MRRRDFMFSVLVEPCYKATSTVALVNHFDLSWQNSKLIFERKTNWKGKYIFLSTERVRCQPTKKKNCRLVITAKTFYGPEENPSPSPYSW